MAQFGATYDIKGTLGEQLDDLLAASGFTKDDRTIPVTIHILEDRLKRVPEPFGVLATHVPEALFEVLVKKTVGRPGLKFWTRRCADGQISVFVENDPSGPHAAGAGSMALELYDSITDILGLQARKNISIVWPITASLPAGINKEPDAGLVACAQFSAMMEQGCAPPLAIECGYEHESQAQLLLEALAWLEHQTCRMVALVKVVKRECVDGAAPPFIYVTMVWKTESGLRSCLKPVCIGAASTCTQAGMPGFVLRINLGFLFKDIVSANQLLRYSNPIPVDLWNIRYQVFNSLSKDPHTAHPGNPSSYSNVVQVTRAFCAAHNMQYYDQSEAPLPADLLCTI